MKKQIYDEEFYRDRDASTSESATRILGIVRELFDLDSAIDFGCGVGTWLKVFKQVFGGGKVLGLDGDYVPKNYMVIGESEFRPTDLNKHIKVDKRFDLAISLEVAEHLPAERAKGFVEDLCQASDLVLFSAATVAQGGTGHLNERRLSYWVDLFCSNGYKMIDIVRPRIWNESSIPVWYRQNVVLFYKLEEYEETINASMGNDLRANGIIDIIHPDLFEGRSQLAINPRIQFLVRLRSLFG